MEGRADLKQKWVIESMRETDYCEEDSWDGRSKWEKSRASGGFSECLYAWEVLLFDQVDILQKKENADVPITIKKRMNSLHILYSSIYKDMFNYLGLIRVMLEVEENKNPFF